MRKIGEGKWEIKSSRYGMDKAWEQKAQHKEYSQWYYNHTVW